MGIEVIEQVDTNTVWQVTEQILAKLRNDDVLKPFCDEKKIHLDWWWEQPFNEDEEYPLPSLCYYISNDVIEVTNEAKNKDRLTVNFTMYMEWRSNADSHVGALTKENFLKFKPWDTAMHRCLAGLKTGGMYTPLKRISGPSHVPGIERKGVLLTTTYQCIIYDSTATPAQIIAHIEKLKLSGELLPKSQAIEE